MKLLTKQILADFKKIGSQQENKNPIVVCKFFDPTGGATWFATEYNPEERIFFGYASLFGLGSPEDEWGYFSLDELESVRGRFGLGIERDIYFISKPISGVAPKAVIN